MMPLVKTTCTEIVGRAISIRTEAGEVATLIAVPADCLIELQAALEALGRAQAALRKTIAMATGAATPGLPSCCSADC